MNRGPIRWLFPGMRIKRWLGLAAFGFFVALFGVALRNHAQSVDVLYPVNQLILGIGRRWHFAIFEGEAGKWSGTFIGLAGIATVLIATTRLVQSISSAINPGGTSASLVDAVYRNRYLAQGPRVVVLGGGTGLSTMLRGLKEYTSNIVAVVTVTDDGGSSGKLKQQLNILPPGDIRNCLVALADAETAMTELFQYRFKGDRASEGLRDHNFGNLLIAAMSQISGGDFEQAIRQTSRVLNIRGRVLPSTLQHVCLRAEMEDGSFVDGETNIAHSPLKIKRISLHPADAHSLDEVVEAIELADIIVIGPGSVYTSIIPNLLVRGIPEALIRSKAKKVYICNVMTQPGETDGMSASDHVKAIAAHVPRPVFNYVMVNTASPSLELLVKYRQTGSILVEADRDRIKSMGYKAIAGNFINQTDVVRHDSAMLAEAIVGLHL
jgi:uncharacterized cofD-like protein